MQRAARGSVGELSLNRPIRYSGAPLRPRVTERRTHHAVVEPLRDEVVQESGVDQLSVVQVERPEGKDHELEGDRENRQLATGSCAVMTQTGK